MKNKFKITLILLTLILVVIISYNPDTIQVKNPENTEQENETLVEIAVTYEKLGGTVNIWPHPVTEENIISLVHMAEKDINNYCRENQIETRFSFTPTLILYEGGTQRGENPPGLDEVIQLDEAGVCLVVGHDFSQANHYCLDYANTHNMILLSPSGIGLGLSKPDDCLFKLMPNEYEDPEVYAKVLAGLLKSRGFEAFVTVGSGRHIFMREWLDVVGEELGYQYRETEVVMDINEADYGSYIHQAAEYVNETLTEYGVGKVCVLIEPFWIDELGKILDEADKYEVLGSVEWFDYGGMPEEGITENNLGSRLAEYGFTRLIMYPANTEVAEEFYQKYIDTVGMLPTASKMYDEAARYDACWLMALSVIEANSTMAADVKAVLPGVCDSYTGVLGNCTLNSYGDRVSADYMVFRWISVGDEARFEDLGRYIASEKVFNFYEIE